MSAEVGYAEARARAARVAILFLDVDGTLTDGRVIVSDDGAVHRAYHTQDGFGIKRILAAGVRVAIVTAAEGAGVLVRARHLGIARVHQGVADKRAVMAAVMAEEDLPPERSAFMGDDLNDLEALRAAGFACAPPEAVPEVLAAAHYVPSRRAGMGAVREVCDFILASRGENAKTEKTHPRADGETKRVGGSGRRV